MRKWIGAIAMLAIVVIIFSPSSSFTEDRDTVQLARTIYALGKHESYQTKLALGSVVMNRVESDWFADSLGEVLSDQQQFPCGTRYDNDSLEAAHAVLSGKRTLPSDALYYQANDVSTPWGSENCIARSGNFSFYSENGNS